MDHVDPVDGTRPTAVPATDNDVGIGAPGLQPRRLPPPDQVKEWLAKKVQTTGPGNWNHGHIGMRCEEFSHAVRDQRHRPAKAVGQVPGQFVERPVHASTEREVTGNQQPWRVFH